MHRYQDPQVPQSTLRAIVRPDAPWWVHMAVPRSASALATFSPSLPAGLAFLAGFLLAIAAGVVIGVGAGLVVTGLVVLATAFVAWSTSRNAVLAPWWTVHGRRLEGEPFHLLEDIDSRFAYAEKHIRTLPTGIRWADVATDVDALLWEAAEHAAEAVTLDAEVHELRYAQPGTPQAALKRSMEERRDQHMQVMKGVQWEAELLARVAGNAAAAARVALARTGSLRGLDPITPSRDAIVAAGALAEARARLTMLAEVWADLDDSGAIAAERLQLEEPD